MEPSHREPDAFTGPVGRNQRLSVWSPRATGHSSAPQPQGGATHTTTATQKQVGSERDQQDTHTHTPHTQGTDLLDTQRGHGGFPQEAGLEVAQDLLHTLKDRPSISLHGSFKAV